MQKILATATLAVVMSACATKGFVRNEIASVNQRVDSVKTSIEAELAAERTARMQGDSGVRMDMMALRQSLDSLKNDFNVRMTAYEEGIKFALPIHFGFNQSEIRQEDRVALDRFATIAKKYYGNARITVEGFADPAGSASYNKRLSLRRAEMVRDYLSTQGVTGSGLNAVGYGETRLVAPGAYGDRPGAELNRRVVFVIESGEIPPSGTTASVE